MVIPAERAWWGAWLLGLALACASALCLAELVLQRANTLEESGLWESRKMELAMAVPGATAFYVTRPALQRNRLHLGAWHAFQEVRQRDAVPADTLRFRFHLEDEEYVAALLWQGDRFEAVRFSRHPEFPEVCLAGSGDGRFTAREALGARSLGAGWHRAELVRGEGRLSLRVDGEAYGSCASALSGALQIGFRGSRGKDVAVDDVALVAGGVTRFEDDFRNRRGRARSITGSFAVMAALSAALALGLRVSVPDPRLLPLAFCTAQVVLLFGAASGLAVDAFYLAGLHPSRVDFRSHESRIETEEQVAERVRAGWTGDGAGPRILFLGSSQTWGAGARDAGDRWVERLTARLFDEPRWRDVEALNAGIPGHHSGRLRKLYEREWSVLAPDVLVVLLGNNDHDPASFAANLERLVTEGREVGSHVVLIPEPNTIENAASLEDLELRHAAMRDVAERLTVPVIEVQAWLAERHDSGFLWWDRVHLTSYGQELFADRVYEQRAWLEPPG